MRVARSAGPKSLHSANGLPSASFSAQPDCRKRSRSCLRAGPIASCRRAASAIERRYEGVTPEPYLIVLVDGALRVENLNGT